MAFTLTHLPKEVAKPLRSYYRRQQVYRLLRLLLMILIAYAAMVMAVVHVDRFWFIDPETRAAMSLVVHILIGILLFGGLLRFFLKRPSVTRISYEIQNKLPNVGDEHLVTLHAMLSGKNTPDSGFTEQMLATLRERSIELGQGIQGATLVTDRALRRIALLFAGFAILIGALFLPGAYEFDLMVHRFYAPRANLPKPSFVKLRLLDMTTVVGRGGEIVVQAEIVRDVPDWARWLLTLMDMRPNQCLIGFHEGEDTTFTLSDTEPEIMSRIDRHLFLHSRSNLTGDLSFRVRCGDAETRAIFVEVVTQPKVTDLRMEVAPPEYTGLPPAEITDFSQPLSLLSGTGLRLSFTSDQPLREQRIQIAGKDEAVQPKLNQETGRYTYEWPFEKNTAFEIVVVNEQGFENVDRPRVAVNLRQDLPPVVRLLEPSSDLRLVPGELLPMTIDLTDDFGLRELTLLYQVNPDPENLTPPREIDVPLPDDATKEADIEMVFDLGGVEANPGDVVQFYLRARDSADNYGESRVIQIELVAFTRGANEQRRLTVLRFFAAALRQIAGAEPAEGATSNQLPPELYTQLRDQAAAIGMNLPETASVQRLLNVLELEIYFTDHPLHQRDLRQIHGILSGAALPFAENREDGVLRRNAVFVEVADSLLPRLIRYRQIKNMMWRYFGLRYEAEKISTKLESMQEEGTTRDQIRSVMKRSELYLETLEDLGAERSSLARETGLFDLQTVQDQAAEMNTRGFFMKGGRATAGSLSRRRAAALAVQEQINFILQQLPGKLVPLSEAETAARDDLMKRFTALEKRLAAEGQHQRGKEWLSTNGRLIGWNPFSTLWSRLQTYGVQTALTQQDPVALNGMLEPGEALREAIDAENALTWQLAFDALEESFLSAGGLSNAERQIGLQLTWLEEARLLGAPTDGYITSLQSTAITPEPGFSPEEVRRRRTAAWQDRSKDLTARKVFAAAAPFVSFPELAGVLKARINVLTERQTTLMALASAASEEEWPLEWRETVQAALQDQYALDDITAAIRLRLADPDVPPAVRSEQTRMLLEIREHQARIGVRYDIFLRDAQVIRPGDIPGDNPGVLQAEVTQFLAVYRWTLERLESILAVLTGESEPAKKTYQALVDLERLQRINGILESLLTEEDPRKTARDFIRENDDAMNIYLYANRGLLSEAKAQLAALDDHLASDRQQVAAARDLLNTAGQALSRMRDIVQAGNPENQGRIFEGVQEAASALGALEIPAGFSVENISRLRFTLDTMIGRLDRLIADVDEIGRGQIRVEGFTAFPDQAREEKRQVKTSVARLQERVRFARSRQVLGILEALAEEPQSAAYHEALAWTHWEMEINRSPLNAVVAFMAATGGQKDIAVSLTNWLLMQNEEAKSNIPSLRHYRPAQKLYHDIIQDLLRY